MSLTLDQSRINAFRTRSHLDVKNIEYERLVIETSFILKQYVKRLTYQTMVGKEEEYEFIREGK